MEKLKWLIIFVMLMVLVAVIFRKRTAKEESEQMKNYAEIQLSHSEIDADKNRTPLIEEGKYVLQLDEFQQINGGAVGWHMEFSMPLGEKEMILEFDLADTSGIFNNPVFPLQIRSDLIKGITSENHDPLYRGYFKVGFVTKISSNESQEEIIPMLDFSCTIDTCWSGDSTGGFQMKFSATHSELLQEIYGLRYSIAGTVDLNEAVLTKRTILTQ